MDEDEPTPYECGHCDETGHELALRGGPPWTTVRIPHAEADRLRLAASRRKLQKLDAPRDLLS